jgi:hypothetical protein
MTVHRIKSSGSRVAGCVQTDEKCSFHSRSSGIRKCLKNDTLTEHSDLQKFAQSIKTSYNVRHTIKWSSIYVSPGCKTFYCNLSAAPRIEVHVHQTREGGHITEWHKRHYRQLPSGTALRLSCRVSLQTRRLQPYLKAGGGPFPKFLFISRTL